MATEINRLLESGAVVPVVDRDYSLKAVADAHEEVMGHSKGGARGKIVVSIE